MRYLEITRRLKERTIVSREEQHKLDAQAFYDMMFNRCDPRKAIEKFVGEVYIQHHPEVADGKEAFIEYFERRAVEFPGKKAHIKRVIAEGDLVVLHCHQEWPGIDDYAGMDIFRFDESGKFVEHWDVLQTTPAKPANYNTIF